MLLKFPLVLLSASVVWWFLSGGFLRLLGYPQERFIKVRISLRSLSGAAPGGGAEQLVHGQRVEENAKDEEQG